MLKRKYRRIKATKNSKKQGYQISLIALGITAILTGTIKFILYNLPTTSTYLNVPYIIVLVIDCINVIILIITLNNREEISTITLPKMSNNASKLSQKLKKLFNDKQITDVLKLSNSTRYGNEMPELHVFVNESLLDGYIAIENIANWERADREKFEQRVSGILAGRFQRFSIVHSELTAGDSFILFYFEDTQTSQRFIVKDGLQKLISKNPHEIKLSKDLTWYSDQTPMLSIVARTRSGKSVLAGRYMANIMLLQGWIVEYNSAKYDRYVKEFNGQSDPIKIVERAEYWCSVMDKRLSEINDAGKEKYLEMENMPNIALFFDELGNLNASLESLDKVDKTLKISSRWITAINRLSATGGSAGIHIIAISQFATKEAFLPSLARVNCSDAVIMLGGAADSPEERKYLMSGFSDMPKRSYQKGEGVARIVSSGKKWETPHYYEAPWFENL